MKTNRTSCNEVREKLPLYVGGDLDPDVMDAVGGHLGLCSECTRHLARATGARRVLVASFRAQEGEVDQPALWPGIRAKLLAEGRIHTGESTGVALAAPRPRRARWAWAFAPIAAAAALVLFLQAGDELPVPQALPNQIGPSAPSPEIAVTPVSTQTGTLERFFPEESGQEVLVPVHLPQRVGGAVDSGAGAPSLAGYRNRRIK